MRLALARNGRSFFTRVCAVSLGVLLVAAGPAFAQGAAGPVPSYARPSYASDDLQISGRIASLSGKYELDVRDDRGYVDHVQMHDGTVINPTGLRLAPGMSVRIAGVNRGSFFSANQIDLPYTSYPGYDVTAYPVYPAYPAYGFGYWPYFGYGGYWGPALGIGISFGWGGWYGGWRAPYWRAPYYGYGYGYRGYGYHGGYYGYGGYHGGYYGNAYRGGYYGNAYRGGYGYHGGSGYGYGYRGGYHAGYGAPGGSGFHGSAGGGYGHTSGGGRR